MEFNSLIFIIEIISVFMLVLFLTKYSFKKRRRSAESIYKLIDDLEKKYIQ